MAATRPLMVKEIIYLCILISTYNMKRLLLLTLSVITSFSIQAQDCDDLFISEYVVGSGNNRALEIYNPTDAAVDLFGYKVGRFRDGSGTPMLLDLAGTIPAFGT